MTRSNAPTAAEEEALLERARSFITEENIKVRKHGNVYVNNVFICFFRFNHL